MKEKKERQTVTLLRLNGNVPTDNDAYNINGEDFKPQLNNRLHNVVTLL